MTGGFLLSAAANASCARSAPGHLTLHREGNDWSCFKWPVVSRQGAANAEF